MTVTNVVLGIAILGLIIYRQMVTRPVRDNFRVPLILAIIGIIELVNFLKGKHVTGSLAAGLAGSLVLAAAFGVVRAMTTKVWVADGQAWRKGTVLTAALWVVALAAHLGYDYLVYKHSNLGDVTIVLYLAVSFAVQTVVLQARAQRLPVQPSPHPESLGPRFR
jgi:hypothetical protein